MSRLDMVRPIASPRDPTATERLTGAGEHLPTDTRSAERDDQWNSPTYEGTAYQRLLVILERHGCGVRAHGTMATAQCPSHNDKHPSLCLRSIVGSVLLWCHAGCETAEVLAVLGLSFRDLYDSAPTRVRRHLSGSRRLPRPSSTTVTARIEGMATSVSLERIAQRSDQQRRIESAAGFWRRRADELAYVGTPTAAEAALACRRHAALLAGEVADVEARQAP
jgi:hypothetical protein